MREFTRPAEKRQPELLESHLEASDALPAGHGGGGDLGEAIVVTLLLG